MSRPILVVEDDEPLGDVIGETLVQAGFTVRRVAAGGDALTMVAQSEFSLVITDVQMPGMDGMALLKELRRQYAHLPVLVMTAFASVQQAVEAMRDGAVDYLVKPFEAEVLVTKASQFVAQGPEDAHQPISADPVSEKIFALATRVAERDVSVLLGGESGVGKEVIARHIHRASKRAMGPFVAVNCAAIPENMLEAMLFGYEKGAFTGAHKACAGKFEQADGGTLLLDEISEMALALQAKLLRVLQEREVERLGGQKMIPLDLRIVATSNRDIRTEVAAGRFREDLFYRLNVFPIVVPPLRRRRRDIGPLALHLLRRHAALEGRAAPYLTPAAEQVLLAHDWPGNVRELDNVMQRALVLGLDDQIDADHIHLDMHAVGGDFEALTDETDDEDSLEGQLRRREYDHILDVMREHAGNRKAVADALGVSPRTLRYKLARMRESGIELPKSA
ncbi:MAG: sigma-54 dependent transcriptional regulator [Pseudomonadota bacterium]